MKKYDAKLWNIFSVFIRLRDAKGTGYCKCISCGKWKPWKGMDAGHFISRRFKAVKYNEKNVNAQCRHCNYYKKGNEYEYGLAIDKKYGKGTAEMLNNWKNQMTKWTIFEYEILIKDYQQKVKLLKNE